MATMAGCVDRDRVRETLASVSQMEEFRVGTSRTDQVLRNIEELLRAEGSVKTQLHSLYSLLERQASTVL